MPAATSEPSVALSFANNFWGKDDAGVGPLLQRMHDAKQTCDELKGFYTARASIEDEYARKLLALSKKPLGASESGSLKASLDVIKCEVEAMAKAHQSIAGQMKTELEEPLAAFSGSMKERRKIVQGGCEKLLKLKLQQTQQVNKTRDRYEQDCLKIKGYLAQGHMVMGQEEKKNKARLEKAQIALTGSSAEYEAAVKALEDTTGRWNRDWKAGCDKFQDLEEERLDFLKQNLWQFANIASTVCVSDDAALEKIRISLEDCEVEKDILGFIMDRGTGQEIPDPPKFINFCRGDYSDDSASEKDDENYSIAQFPRAGNPTFRSSSSNASHSSSEASEPSVAPEVEPVQAMQQFRNQSRHEEERRELELKERAERGRRDQRRRAIEPQTPPTREVVANGSARSRREQQQQLQAQQQQIASPSRGQRHDREQPQRHAIQNAPHNEYPLDGMTMYCRPGNMISDSSASSSPARSPSGQDAGSDYSNPTSVSSGGEISQQIVSAREDEKQVQKRKSGFFSNVGPFRRKSKTDKDQQFLLQQQQQQIVTQQQQQQQIVAQEQRVESSRQREQAAIMAPPSMNSRKAYSAPVVPRAGTGDGSMRSYHSPNNRSRQSQLMLGNERHSSPEPIDPRASLALNIGGNVLEVSQPAKNTPESAKPNDEDMALDPIAQALAELKGVTKNTSVRNSADRFFGLATPAPSSATPGLNTNTALAAAQRGTPPPTYAPKTSSLGLPPPAFTSAQMQQTTQRYVDQRDQLLVGRPQIPAATSDSPSRAGSGRQRAKTIDYQKTEPSNTSREISNPREEPPRATSPIPNRSVSPRPQLFGDNHYRDGSPKPRADYSRSASPNPYMQSRPGTASSNRGQYAAYSNPPSPMTGQEVALSQYRASSPALSHHSHHSGGGSYGSRGRDSRHSYYGGGDSQAGAVATYQGGGGQVSRPRSKSMADTNKQYARDGRPIMCYARAMYQYTAAIPVELTFAKGDILAVLRQQDDGWWEAEIVGVQGRPGLVPSNYLESC